MTQMNPRAPHHQDLERISPATTGHDPSSLESAERHFPPASQAHGLSQSQQIQGFSLASWGPLFLEHSSFWAGYQRRELTPASSEK